MKGINDGIMRKDTTAGDISLITTLGWVIYMMGHIEHGSPRLSKTFRIPCTGRWRSIYFGFRSWRMHNDHNEYSHSQREGIL